MHGCNQKEKLKEPSLAGQNCCYCRKGVFLVVMRDFVETIGGSKIYVRNLIVEKCNACGREVFPPTSTRRIEAAITKVFGEDYWKDGRQSTEPKHKPIWRCTWCCADTPTKTCKYCGKQAVDRTLPHLPHWSRSTLQTVECKVCDREIPIALQGRAGKCLGNSEPEKK